MLNHLLYSQINIFKLIEKTGREVPSNELYYTYQGLTWVEEAMGVYERVEVYTRRSRNINKEKLTFFFENLN